MDATRLAGVLRLVAVSVCCSSVSCPIGHGCAVVVPASQSLQARTLLSTSGCQLCGTNGSAVAKLCKTPGFLSPYSISRRHAPAFLHLRYLSGVAHTGLLLQAPLKQSWRPSCRPQRRCRRRQANPVNTTEDHTVTACGHPAEHAGKHVPLPICRAVSCQRAQETTNCASSRPLLPSHDMELHKDDSGSNGSPLALRCI